MECIIIFSTIILYLGIAFAVTIALAQNSSRITRKEETEELLRQFTFNRRGEDSS